MESKLKKIYWIDLNRFDQKIDKSTWLEIGEVLTAEDFIVYLLCGFKKEKFFPKNYKINIKYFKAIDLAGLFRYILLLNIFCWLIWRVKSHDLIIVRPEALFIAPLLKLTKKCKIHIDVRTIPVEVNTLRDHIDYYLFWKLPLNLLKKVPDSFSFITALLKENIEKEFNIHFQDYVIWGSGVNIQHFKGHIPNKRKSNKRFVITYAGVLTKNRGVNLVIDSLAMLNGPLGEEVSFRIIGDGPDLKNLRKRTATLDLENSVEFLGHIPYEKIPIYLRDTDCFICPLPDRPGWNVSSPIKIFEYLACAKPIILTPIPAHLNVIGDKDFVVWTRGDSVEDFQKAIEYTYENHVLLRAAAKEAPAFVKARYEWKVQGKKLADYLKKKYC